MNNVLLQNKRGGIIPQDIMVMVAKPLIILQTNGYIKSLLSAKSIAILLISLLQAYYFAKIARNASEARRFKLLTGIGGPLAMSFLTSTYFYQFTQFFEYNELIEYKKNFGLMLGNGFAGQTLFGTASGALVSGLESVTGIAGFGIVALMAKTGGLNYLSQQFIAGIDYLKEFVGDLPLVLETSFKISVFIGGIRGLATSYNFLINQLNSITSSIGVFQKFNKLLYVTVNYKNGQPYFGEKKDKDQTMQEIVYWISAAVKPVFSILLTEYLLSAQLNQLSDYSKIGATIIPTSITNIVRFVYKISIFYFNTFYFSPIHFQFNNEFFSSTCLL